MTTEEMKTKVIEQERFLGAGWGFLEHISGVSCRKKSGRFYFYNGARKISINDAAERLLRAHN